MDINAHSINSLDSSLVSKVPPLCQCHLAFFVPKVSCRAFPSMKSLNSPGAPGAFQGATQSRVRTQTRRCLRRGSGLSAQSEVDKRIQFAGCRLGVGAIAKEDNDVPVALITSTWKWFHRLQLLATIKRQPRFSDDMMGSASYCKRPPLKSPSPITMYGGRSQVIHIDMLLGGSWHESWC